MDFITDLFNKIVKLIFDILAQFGVDTDNVPEWLQPKEETTPEA